MALRTTTSSRGLAAAAPQPMVKPASSTSFAICAVTSVCSSGGIIWIGSMPGALFQERCRWASQRPGISVAPMPSMTVCPPPPAAAVHARGALGHLLDAVALDGDFAGIGIFAGAIENAHVGEDARRPSRWFRCSRPPLPFLLVLPTDVPVSARRALRPRSAPSHVPTAAARSREAARAASNGRNAPAP